MYNTNSSMHDDILGQILSNNTSDKLKVIVSSIQKEQNAAIRNPQNRFLLIYGLAGSGKTSVGLHRMAYILYHNRTTIKASDIVVLSNNAIFNSYISNILPDLGEEDAEHIVFSDLIKSVLNEEFTVENYIKQYQALEQNTAADRINAIRVKYSEHFLAFCTNYFKSYRFIVPELRYREHVIIAQEDFQKYWDERHFSSYRAHFDNLSEKIRQHYEEYFITNKESIKKDIIGGTDDILTDQKVAYRFEQLLEHTILSAVQKVRNVNNVDTFAQLCRVCRNYCEINGIPDTLATELEISIRAKKFLYEDALLYLLVSVLMGEVSPRTNVSHVLIDEAQDYNLIQLYIIKALYPRSYYTLLADINQAIHQITSIHRYEDFNLIFGDALQKCHLSRSYRSSGPINALAFQLIGKSGGCFIDDSSYFNRDGKLPYYIVTKNFSETITKSISSLSGYNTIGIITATAELAVDIQASLNSSITVQLITDPQDEIHNRIAVLPLILTKGLEFDVVFLVNCFSDSGREELDRHKAYLACTRALHALFILASASLPGCFDDCVPLLNIEFQS
jgi:DNA helicase II / ATP-dependent DNA helicase PcrA